MKRYLFYSVARIFCEIYIGGLLTPSILKTSGSFYKCDTILLCCITYYINNFSNFPVKHFRLTLFPYLVFLVLYFCCSQNFFKAQYNRTGND